MVNESSAVEKQKLWDAVLSETTSSADIVRQFLAGKLDLDYLSYNYQNDEKGSGIRVLVKSLLGTPVPTIRALLSAEPLSQVVSAANIPQFSNFATAAIYLPELLLNAPTQLTYRELGYALFSETKSDGAAEKYGQNHGGLAIQLGLASTIKVGRKSMFCPTPLTAVYCQLEYTQKMELLQRLCFRIPIVQIASASQTPIETVDEYLQITLAKSTYLRRKSNVLEVLAFALGE